VFEFAYLSDGYTIIPSNTFDISEAYDVVLPGSRHGESYKTLTPRFTIAIGRHPRNE
jgi:hypothetical protein